MLYCTESQIPYALSLDDYQRLARQSDQQKRKGSEGLRIPLLGLFGEVGSLLTLPKRVDREDPTYSTYRDSLVEEFGDVLWYLSNLASRHDVPLSALAQARGATDHLRISRKSHRGLTFSHLDRRSTTYYRTDRTMKKAGFFALGGSVGRLMNEYAAGEHWGLDRDEFVSHLARAFRLIVNAASDEHISLHFCAWNNLAKTHSRWPRVKKPNAMLDRDDRANEQIPRLIVMKFEERKVNKKTYVFQSCCGINVGDRLTDNKAKEDNYRFHDVFHLAYAAILSWSPVMRALFKVKRKSKPVVDENQDGARAILIEEGIATWIFNHGIAHKDFANTKKIDYSLLKAVRQMVAGYEVEDRWLWEWEKAILDGFAVFRQLKKYRKGWVVADLQKRRISFHKTEPSISRR